MTRLHIGRDFDLPADAVTQAIGILAKRRVGKSYTARRVVEQLYKAGQQIVVVDPKGDWWGIRSSADGKSPGLPVVILGGERGDVPLEVGSGEVVAKLVVEERVSVLLDLSLFRKHEVATFMTAFLENLYRLKAREIFRTPLMLVVDEADAIFPQKPQENEARMLGAGEDIVRRGGQRGIGCMMISQRSAVLNKNVLTQVEMLVALRTIAPQDLKAMDSWVEVHGEKAERDTLMSSLPSLPVGDAWFWSPGWPTKDGIFKRVSVLPIETFDSGATPKSGEKRVEPKNLADVDLASLTKQMAATIERAKADDPKELRKTIATLNKEIAQLKKTPAATTVKPIVDQTAIDRAVEKALASERARITRELKKVGALVGPLGEMAQKASVALVGVFQANEQPTTAPTPVTPLRREVPRVEVARRAAPEPRRSSSHTALPSASKRIIDAIAFYNSIGQSEPHKRNVAGFAGLNPAISTWRNALTPLRAQNLIVERGDAMSLTAEGSSIAEVSAPPSLEELHRQLLAKLPSASRAIAQVAIDEHPNKVERAEIGRRTNIDVTLSTYRNALTPLRAMGLIDEDGTALGASDLLFPEGLY